MRDTSCVEAIDPLSKSIGLINLDKITDIYFYGFGEMALFKEFNTKEYHN